jgi:hypothetical protein
VELVVHDNTNSVYTGTSVLRSTSVLLCFADYSSSANYDKVCTVVTVSGTTLSKGTALVLTEGFFGYSAQGSAALFLDAPM